MQRSGSLHGLSDQVTAEEQSTTNAGQSLDDRTRRVIERQINDRIWFAGLIGTQADDLRIVRLAFDITVNPVLLTIAFITIAIAIVPGIIRTRKQIRAMRLGRDGERAEGQALEYLRDHGISGVP
ncbi:MAG: hypothetical protein U5Q16_08520 [Gammaproteobacteria bacterium]|nr:hypothetical protein [Gammaproteobacteria bacterium]